MDGSSSTSCCLCHRYVRKSVQKVGISNAKLCQGLLVVVRALLRFCGILDIRDTRRVKFCHRQNIFQTLQTQTGIPNIEQINLYMHDDYRFYTRCLNICITIFIYFFKSEMIFINITMQILYIFINIFDALMRF